MIGRVSNRGTDKGERRERNQFGIQTSTVGNLSFESRVEVGQNRPN
jgi:hypothetical protein